MAFKIHPGIGLGRAGDSPTDWFIAPETSDAPQVPVGGYRDAEGLLKRAGARFRVFDHSASGFVELTAPEWEIEWTVVLRKGGVVAAATVANAPNQTVDVPLIPFSSPAVVSLGQLRTDSEGRLVILSGVVAGTDFDARCEGRVTARVRHPGDPWDDSVVASWVLLTSPDFLPQTRDEISACDRLLESWRHHGLFSPAELAAQPSTRADVYPILRAQNNCLPFASEPTPAAGDYPGIDSDPAFSTSAYGLTLHQATILNRWKDGDAIPDMATMVGEPAPLPFSPQELDRGPLTHACGFGFWDVDHAGVYADYTPTLLFSEPLRFDEALPDAVLAEKLLPTINWTNDYSACSGEWPSQVPNTSAYYESDWRAQGFVVLQGDAFVYQESNADPYILQLTHSIDFGIVNPAIDGPGWANAAIAFEVGSTEMDLIQFDLTLPLPAQVVAVVLSASVSDVPLGEVQTVRLWIAYQTGADIAPGATVQVTDNQGNSYTVAVQGSTGAPLTHKLALVLDASTSMDEDRGDGVSKLTGLKQAVGVLLTLADDNSGIGVAPFSTDALPAQPVLTLGAIQPDSSTGRETVENFVSGLSTVAITSIGDGLESGRLILDAAAGYDGQALVVVTDGKENSQKYISEVASSIDARTFAIGIGTASNVNVSTLQTLTGNLSGYLLLTGPTASDDNGLLLDKYFVQILSGAQNHQLIVDPVEHVVPGTLSRIPFPVTETENSFSAVVVSDAIDRLQIALETPEGEILSPAIVSAAIGGKYIEGQRVRAFRISLPLFVNPTTSYFAGQWFLRVAAKPESAQRGRAPAIPCCVAVSANSTLELDAALQQAGVRLGSKFVLQACLDWYGVPFPGKAHLVAEVSGPTGSFELPLAATSPGRFAAEFVPQRIGDYGVRLRARGLSPRQFPFLREFTGSLAILHDEFAGSPRASCGEDAARKCLRSLKHRLADRLCSLGRRLKDEP